MNQLYIYISLGLNQNSPPFPIRPFFRQLSAAKTGQVVWFFYQDPKKDVLILRSGNRLLFIIYPTVSRGSPVSYDFPTVCRLFPARNMQIYDIFSTETSGENIFLNTNQSPLLQGQVQLEAIDYDKKYRYSSFLLSEKYGRNHRDRNRFPWEMAPYGFSSPSRLTAVSKPSAAVAAPHG